MKRRPGTAAEAIPLRTEDRPAKTKHEHREESKVSEEHIAKAEEPEAEAWAYANSIDTIEAARPVSMFAGIWWLVGLRGLIGIIFGLLCLLTPGMFC